MRTSVKYLLVASLAAAALASGAGSAFASRSIEVNPLETTGTAGRVSFESFEQEVVCPLTVALTLHRVIAKTDGGLAGRARFTFDETRCTSGKIRALAGPWHVTYQTFSGTLPNIRLVVLRIMGAEFLVESHFGLVRCLFHGDFQMFTRTNVRVTELEFEVGMELPVFVNLGMATCPMNLLVEGTVRLGAVINLRLV